MSLLSTGPCRRRSLVRVSGAPRLCTASRDRDREPGERRDEHQDVDRADDDAVGPVRRDGDRETRSGNEPHGCGGELDAERLEPPPRERRPELVELREGALELLEARARPPRTQALAARPALVEVGPGSLEERCEHEPAELATA